MDFLIFLLAVWWLGAFVTYVVLFKRFMVRRDIRRPRDVDGFDLFGPVVGMLLIVCALVLMNPVRYAHVVVKALGWPATLYLAFAGRRTRTAAGSSPSESHPADQDQSDPPTTPIVLDDSPLTPAGPPSLGAGARKPASSPGSVLPASPYSHIPTSRRL